MQSKICHYLQDILIHQLFVPGILPQTLFRENFVSEYFILSHCEEQKHQYCTRKFKSQFSDKFCVKTFAEYIVNSSFTNFAINEPDVIYSALLKIYALGAIFSTLLLLCRESLSNWYSSANFRLHSYEYLKYQTQCTLPDSLTST